MKRRVLALGLDAADPVLMEPWMEQGLLPNLNFIRQNGAYGHLRTQIGHQGQHENFSSTEPLWVMAMTGCLAHQTGFWETIEYDASCYEIKLDSIYGGYSYDEYKPFYALDKQLNVTTFDIPVSRVLEGIKGTQITGWGGHHPCSPRESAPPEALEIILRRCGPNPINSQNNHGAWWETQDETSIQQALAKSIKVRTSIGKALVKRQDWDLCMLGFSELHTAGHELYAQSQPDHPLHPCQKPTNGSDPLLQAYQQVDEAVGQILSTAPTDSYLVSYSLNGIGANHSDLLSLFFLSEILYRWNFPGQVGFSNGNISQPPGAPLGQTKRGGWSTEIWRQLADNNLLSRWWRQHCPTHFWPNEDNGLISPTGFKRQPHSQSWIPTLAYQHRWHAMRAFALPSFTDGHIRINLQGREANGQVAPEDYDCICEQIITMLYELKDSRSSLPLVKAVQRTRPNADQKRSDKTSVPTKNKIHRPPYADLIVLWNELPTDVIESPQIGRIGPVTYNRAGGHRPRGHFMVKGPDIPPGSQLPLGQAVDVASTLLHLLGHPCPEYFDGQCLVN